MRVVAIDPGTHTGVAVWDQEEGLVESVTLGPARGFKEEYGLCKVLYEFAASVDVVVIEDFILRVGPGVQQSSNRDGLSAVRITAVLQTLMAECGWEMVFQQPSEKGFATSERLRKAGLWKVGADNHQRDAAKHLFVYLRKAGLV